MQFQLPLDAIRHASAQATTTGKPWAVYSSAGLWISAPVGTFAEHPLEVCQP